MILLILSASCILLLYYAWYPEKGTRFLIPEKYSGWICVSYNAEGTPPLEKQDGFSLIKVPKNGIVKTSSSMGSYTEEGCYIPRNDEYYYYSEKGTREAKELDIGGGFTRRKTGEKEITSYFWVSTKGNAESDYGKYVKGFDALQDPTCGPWETKKE